ncbi:MAG: SPFH domain-containing protein [Gemmatimonadota bacterium]
MKEKLLSPPPGLLILAGLIAAFAVAVMLFVRAARTENAAGIFFAIGLLVLILLLAPGFIIVHPNEAKALTLFGRYVGTVRQPGLWFVNPFTAKKSISLKIRNFETTKLKVNDSHSNPIDIAAVVVWQVIDSAEALFEVDDYDNYVHVQSESAVRGLASIYPYDSHQTGELALSTSPTEVSKDLMTHLQERLGKAGVQVLEARISHLAYAPEIASSMLQRQQASAIIAARQKIVEGAVGMVQQALEMLSDRQIVHLDDERKASMVSNLLVVLCSERSTQPVINAGTLYS